jgi:hypothetical protein
MEPVLGERMAAAFARDGVVCARSVLDPAEVAVAAAAIDAVLASPGPLAQVAGDPRDPGAFTEDFCRWREVPGIEQLARHSRVPAVAAALMGTPPGRSSTRWRSSTAGPTSVTSMRRPAGRTFARRASPR